MCYDTLLCGYTCTPHRLPLIPVWAAGAASLARSPDCPLPSQIHQIIRGQPKMFPGQLGDSLSLVCPKDWFKFWACLEHGGIYPKNSCAWGRTSLLTMNGQSPLFQLRTTIPGRRPSTTCPEVPPPSHPLTPRSPLLTHSCTCTALKPD